MGMCVVVMFHCQVVVVVCGRPGMFMVVGVTSGRHGGRPLLSWWLWDEEGSSVTICDNVISECLLYNFVVLNTQLNGVPLKLCSVRFF